MVAVQILQLGLDRTALGVAPDMPEAGGERFLQSRFLLWSGLGVDCFPYGPSVRHAKAAQNCGQSYLSDGRGGRHRKVLHGGEHRGRLGVASEIVF